MRLKPNGDLAYLLATSLLKLTKSLYSVVVNELDGITSTVLVPLQEILQYYYIKTKKRIGTHDNNVTDFQHKVKGSF